ncbi:MAG: Putative TonB-dependent receptor [uncultured Cytophagales bacterium]|uniref:TonB-dependent receptor n=1 Tax=uncultured Cytophagales bacterium TaxID=158755 RepID=A0A6J4JN64_9SPHI|nr:MAG: Putative TonB-dependent receptor [uncultured Cytophagales bacterium]
MNEMKTLLHFSKRANLVLALALLLPVVAAAQGTVSGFVLEKEGVPAPFATVALITPKDSAIVKGRATDEDGSFFFENVADGEYIVSISYVGYNRTFSRPFAIGEAARGVVLGNVLLAQSTQALQEVVVTAQKPLIERKADTYVMNVENSALGSGNAVELMKIVPFVEVGQGGGISMRGMGNVLILIDGRPTPKETVATVLQSLPADEIARIEFLTNPPARYDAAAGGVINIITKKSKRMGLTGTYRAGASQGVELLTNTGGNLTYRREKWSLYGRVNLAANRVHQEHGGFREFSSPDGSSALRFGDSTTSLNRSKVYAAQAGFDFFPHPNHTVGVVAGADIFRIPIRSDNYTRFSTPGAPPDSILRTDLTMALNSATFNYSLTYKASLSPTGRELNLLLTRTDYGRNYDQFFRQEILGPGFENPTPRDPFRTSNPADLSINIAQLDYTHPLTGDWKLEGGVKYVGTRTTNAVIQEVQADGEWVTNPDLTNRTTYLEDIVAGYGLLSKDFKRGAVRVGLRTEGTTAEAKEAFTRRYLGFFPSFYAQRSVSDHYKVALSYRRQITRPDYQAMLPFTIYNTRYSASEGNLYLQPQYTNLFSLTHSIRKIDVTLDYTLTKGLIARTPRVDLATNTTFVAERNIDQSAKYGGSVLLPVAITSWWQANNSLWASYQVTEGKFNDQAVQLSLFGYAFNTTHSFTLPKSLKVDLGFFYASPSMYGLYRTESRHNAWIAIRKGILAGKGDIRLSFDDMFRGSVFRGTLEGETIRTHYSSYYDSRRVGIAFSYRFGKKTVDAAKEKKLGNEDAVQRIKTQ